jgi:hypothetical protein
MSGEMKGEENKITGRKQNEIRQRRWQETRRKTWILRREAEKV